MNKISNIFKIGFRNTLESILSGAISEFSKESSLIDEDILEIMENPKDKKELDEAVSYLINQKSTKQRDIKLSDKTITISLG